MNPQTGYTLTLAFHRVPCLVHCYSWPLSTISPRQHATHKVRLFADDCVLYRQVTSEDDCKLLQDDLHSLEDWEDTWKMSFNASKCNTISITRKKNKIQNDYSLHRQTLERVPSTTYLGIELKSDLTWKNHIDRTCAKAKSAAGISKTKLTNSRYQSKRISIQRTHSANN